MRLSKEEVAALKSSVHKMSREAEIYLFGSRVDDKKRGGDIDILIVSKELSKRELRRIRLDFFEKFGEQKLDIVLNDGSFKKPFTRLIREKAILL